MYNMMWLSIAIVCFIWVIIWTIIHISMFKDAIRYRCTVKGLPLWTVIIPLIITVITLMLFFNSIE